MYRKSLASIPQATGCGPQKQSIEWEISRQVSVAFLFLEKYGYTAIAEVKQRESTGGVDSGRPL